MKYENLFGRPQTQQQSMLNDIAAECSDFFQMSECIPMFKRLPTTYDGIKRIKIRKRKQIGQISQPFNEAFKSKTHDLHQRALFVDSTTQPDADDGMDNFYVFPINGFKYIYCTEVRDSSNEYKQTFDALFETFGTENDGALGIIKDLLQYSYHSNNLVEGLESGSEIIVYNIPYFYGVRESTVESYEDLLYQLGV